MGNNGSPNSNHSIIEEEPPELSEAYQKAHKQYGFYAALLIAWELVGIDVKETPLQNVNVILKSPQALPWVLIALVLYFGFKFTIEWGQCSKDRTKKTISKIDFWVAHGIAILSLVLYVSQTISHLQVANYPFSFLSILFTIINFLLGGYLSIYIFGYNSRLFNKYVKVSIWLLKVTLPILLLMIEISYSNNNMQVFLWPIILIPFGIGFIIFLITVMVLRISNPSGIFLKR
jgi:hypothetical protein